ncbi:retrovirus-related pol polyprotein from transposon TNT 1-94 [Tanacetum coccineum]
MINNSRRRATFRISVRSLASRDKEVNMATRDSDDALVRLRSSKVRLADDKTLDITSIGDVILKTSFNTSWTLKDVRYIPGLKRRLISVRQLYEEGYHVGFGDQQCKVTKDSLVVARRNKCGSLIGMNMLASKGNVPDVQRVDIYFYKPGCLGKQKKLSFIMSEKTRKLQSRSCGGFNANLQVKCLKFNNGGEYSSGSDEMRYSFQDTKSHQVIQSRDITFVDSIYGAKSATDSSSLTKPIHKSQVMLVDIPENLADGSFEDSGRSDEEYSEDGASSKDEGSETPRITSRKEGITKIVDVQGALNDTSTLHKSEGFQLAGQKENLECRLKEIMYGLIQAPRQCWAKLVLVLISEGSLSLLKILGTKSLAEMFTRLVMKEKSKLSATSTGHRERGYSQFDDVSSGYLVSKVS